MTTQLRSVVTRAHPNIALAKYWGKTEGDENAPAVPSLSVTLAGMTTETTLTLDPSLSRDEIVLNDVAAEGLAASRVVKLLDRVRALTGVTTFARVSSRNDFPTAAGLASSASGFAALALAATRAMGSSYGLGEISDLARRASETVRFSRRRRSRLPPTSIFVSSSR
jgi:diphosphomevalonate decarboxylase